MCITLQVQIRHRNFIECTHSLTYINLFTNKDIIVQMASCSYDVHVQEIIGTLIVGSSIVMLRPQGNMNVEYVLMILHEKQVSYMQTVPAYLDNMLNVLLQHDCSKFKLLRTIDIGGKWFVISIENFQHVL